MPLFDLGSLFLDHVVFITNLVYINIALTNAEPSILFPLYVVSKLLARGPDDWDSPTAKWPPPVPTW
ncbi:hypothetical protein CKAH01_00292 [Colletotrichum kahawae]|nr:hypothetical protein CKAH01_00292 [Colletotrichum kahawae]